MDESTIKSTDDCSTKTKELKTESMDLKSLNDEYKG